MSRTNSLGENLLKDLSNQSTNVFNFKAFQKEVSSKSFCIRSIGAITGAAGGTGAVAGGIFCY